jgi:Protein of unknown function (DUF2635)
MSGSTMRIKPKPGLIVRDPVTYRPLAVEGEDKPRDQYWMRRLRDGDVVPVEQSEPDGEVEIPPRREA